MIMRQRIGTVVWNMACAGVISVGVVAGLIGVMTLATVLGPSL